MVLRTAQDEPLRLRVDDVIKAKPGGRASDNKSDEDKKAAGRKQRGDAAGPWRF